MIPGFKNIVAVLNIVINSFNQAGGFRKILSLVIHCSYWRNCCNIFFDFYSTGIFKTIRAKTINCIRRDKNGWKIIAPTLASFGCIATRKGNQTRGTLLYFNAIHGVKIALVDFSKTAKEGFFCKISYLCLKEQH